MPADVADLAHLDAPAKNIADLTGIEHLTALKELHLDHNQIEDLAPLARLVDLEVLTLAANQIGDISALADLIHLKKLQFSTNQISDIAALARLVELEEVSFYCNQLSDISALENLVHLQDLNLNDNQISDISALARLTELNWLALDRNQISDIAPLAGLKKIKTLSIRNNLLSDINSLAHLTQLEKLFVSDNQISDVFPLSQLRQLTHLYLDNNQISDIAPVVHLKQLINLTLSSNRISDISALSRLESLTHLYLNNNQISDLSALIDNSHIESISFIDVRDNPLTSEALKVQILELLMRGVGWVEYAELAAEPYPDLPLPSSLAAIPLETGNYWIFDSIVRTVNTEGETTDLQRHKTQRKIEVHEQVTLRQVDVDTRFRNENIQSALGLPGEAYYKISFTDGMGFFPAASVDTDTLLVRADTDGNILTKGYSRPGEMYLAAEEQPWLLMSGPTDWQLGLTKTYFWGRYTWIGGGRWREFYENAFQGVSTSEGDGLSLIAQRFLPDLSPSSPNKLVKLIGSGPATHSDLSIALLTGLGPLQTYEGYFEFQSFSLELGEAFVGGHLYKPDDDTSIRSMSWGQIKRYHKQ